MAVRFILGTSGTGKTSHCIAAICDSLLDPRQTHPLILLVPEQATYQAERAILAVDGIGGYSRLQVLSFSRLEFMLQGRYTAGAELSRIAQQLIIHRILYQHEKSFRVFGASARHPGLAAQIAQTIVELHQYAQSAEDIKNLADKLAKSEPNAVTALKFADIALIYSEYLKCVEGAFVNPDIQLSTAAKAVADATFLKGAHLWVDGFSGFTAQELAMLRELLKTAAESHIALCLDSAANPNALDPLSIFSPTERTWVALTEMIKKNNLKLAEPLLLQKPLRFSSSPQLAHIEKNLFKDDPVTIKAGEAVQVVAAANARAEVEYVARRIVTMVREQSWRYRDIAVVASDLGGYRHYIQAAFEDCHIPFFIDMAKPINQHPIVETILSALAVVVNDFESSDVFAFLKTDLSPLKRDEADLLENYCLAHGIDGTHWKEKTAWRYAQNKKSGFDEQIIDDIRKRAVAVLIELEAKFGDSKSVTAAQIRKTIDEFLQSLKVNEKLAQWIENPDEHRQFARQLAQLFDELAQVFGDDVMPLEDFAALLTRAFEQMSLRLIPPSLDQVLVGSIERSRHPDLKAIFLLGASQKQFPVPVRFDSILTDDDRQQAEAAGCELAEGTATQLAQRQYLVYIAFTRPSHLLCVSYPMADDKGAQVPPSSFVSSLQLLFVDLKPQLVGYDSPQVLTCVNEHELTDVLCTQLGADSNGDDAQRKKISSLLSPLMADDELAPAAKTAIAAVGYTNQATLDKDFAAGLFAGELKSSITKLGSFTSCPYQYFAKYTLKLKEREIYSFEPPDLGKFYHEVLCELFKRLTAAKTNVAALNEQELLAYLSETTTAVITENTYYTGFMSRSQFNKYIIDTATVVLEDFVRDMAQTAKAGQLRQIAAEMPLEYRMWLPDKRELLLRGYIDRIDVADDDTNAAVVFDYKSREKSFSWSKCYHGLDLQMVFYMFAIDGKKVGRIDRVNPVGAFYMPIDVGTQRADIDELETKAEKFRRKAKGLFNGEMADILDSQLKSGWSSFYNYSISKDDGVFGNYINSGALKPEDFQEVLAFAKTKVIELANRIVAGDIAVRPYRLGGVSPCSMCEFMPLCRFDWHINDYNFMESLNKTAVLEKIGGDANGR
ncbi:MAG: exodeoxyribonuclease V subunit gamma [Sedimentisphaerales bacterium]|nr:exodeoxyribonuclease V subunit gamma [Sedimentisphaerales bacterium]